MRLFKGFHRKVEEVEKVFCHGPTGRRVICSINRPRVSRKGWEEGKIGGRKQKF